MEFTFTLFHSKTTLGGGINAPFFCRWEHLGLAMLRKWSLGHTGYRFLVHQSSNLMFLLGRTPDSLCKGILCLLEISTTSMLHFFSKRFPFPSSSPDKLSIACGPWSRLAAAPPQACQTQIKFEGQMQPESIRAFYPASRLIISYYFSRASTALLKTRGLFCELLNGLF